MDHMLQNYLQRWQAVQQIEQQELAAGTFELRWQQLNALFKLAAGLGILPERDEKQETYVYQLWAKLKNTP